VTVALTGDGGDELFQGYGAYQWANRLEKRSTKILAPLLRDVFRKSRSSRLQRIAHMLDPVGLENRRSHIFSQEQYLFEQVEIRQQLLKNPDDFSAFCYDESFLKTNTLPESEKQALFDLKYYLKDDLLVKVDRASMYFALECRCPLLDHNVVEFAYNLHHSLKVRQGKSKWILKELLRDFIPDHLVDRKKWGFSVPLGNWLKRDLRYLIDHFLSEDCIREVGVFNSSYIEQLKRDFFSGKDYLYNRLWAVIVLHKWWKENNGN
jgi:asparagine synthase (glutamine-hydrolysing)